MSSQCGCGSSYSTTVGRSLPDGSIRRPCAARASERAVQSGHASPALVACAPGFSENANELAHSWHTRRSMDPCSGTDCASRHGTYLAVSLAAYGSHTASPALRSSPSMFCV
ncbi:hypothetical protein LPJ57_009681 [Coemansia sp. RSA 486]|nr:hypothetical protein LPJ57_009681 [Coemansia sp. RSA 486]